MKIDKLLPEHISGYLPYNLECCAMGETTEETLYTDNPKPIIFVLNGIVNNKASIKKVAPYAVIDFDELFPNLRKLSSITSEELELFSICFRIWYDKPDFNYKLMIYSDIEMCYKLHIDFRDLIGSELAIDKESLKD